MSKKRRFIVFLPSILFAIFLITSSYDGSTDISGKAVFEEDAGISDQLIKISLLENDLEPGDIVSFRIDISNLGKQSKDGVLVYVELENLEGEVITEEKYNLFFEGNISTTRDLITNEGLDYGRYLLRGTLFYTRGEDDLTAVSLTSVRFKRSVWDTQLFGFPIGYYVLIILFFLLNILFYKWYIRKRKKKRRYEKIKNAKYLPKSGKNSVFLGKVAETSINAYFPLNDLKTHVLIAGSTGSGKTVAAQDLVEEALMRGVSVIVFDPTAQWTGFFRECEDKDMLKRYEYFGMNQKKSKKFKGQIHSINHPLEFINLKRYLKQKGTITIFNVSRLSPSEVDIVVSSSIEQVFLQQLEESVDLKTLIVYDEVHRLLPKFGGSGKGFLQLERGAREFRKWGIGLILISQVLSDFVGEVKANIGTEIQMRTRYEGDLERVKMKYGEKILGSVVKEAVGTGMIVNAEYNNGRPYFVSFRPVLHDPHRLSIKKLREYDKYHQKLEDVAYMIAQLKFYKVDTFDYELEFRLAKSKAITGNFNLVDIYLEGLMPKLKHEFKKKKIKPKKRKTNLMDVDKINKSIENAKQTRKLLK